jgi:glycosyltransferase involved in cell wall biosynthesis
MRSSFVWIRAIVFSSSQMINNSIGKEVIVVNDCPKDNTHQKITEYTRNNPGMNIRYFVHEVNMWKGATIHSDVSVLEN